MIALPFPFSKRGRCLVDKKTHMRVFWADVQKIFLLPLLVIFAVYFFVRANALEKAVFYHHASPGHLEAIRLATEARVRAEEVGNRVDRLERIVNHKGEK
jgi:hypothetical protein